MRKISRNIVRSAFNDERGQTLPFVALLMFGMLGVSGLVVDVGHAYVVRGELQNAANAAALAAAGLTYNSTSSSVTPITEATQYGPGSGDENAQTGLSNVTTTVTTVCLNSLMPTGASCGSGTSPNAVKVVNSTSVKTFLMGLFGVPSLKVGATATASMGPASQPWNIAIIIDSTGSMATADANCGSITEFQCALNGVQTLLGDVNPCPNGVSSCSGSGANVRVSLFTFPNVLTSYNGVLPVVSGSSADSIKDEVACSGSPATWTNYAKQPIAAPYTLPIPGDSLPIYTSGNAPSTYDVGLNYSTYTQTSTGKKWAATYQITPFLSDYYSPSSTGRLNSSSSLVKVVGDGSTNGCLTYTFGVDGTGGGSGFGNTYFAGAIYSAQAALIAEQAANTTNPGQNAIIFLSDGQANASDYEGKNSSGVSFNSSAYGTANSTNQYADANEFPSGPALSEVGPTSTSPAYPVPAYYTPATNSDGFAYDTLSSSPSGGSRSGSSKGVYPDWFDQCQQGMAAAQYATSKGTRVYAVAYGAENSGCNSGWSIGLTDTTLQSSVVNSANISFALSGVDPCVTMENIASTLTYFYSDYQQSGSSSNCTDSAHSTVSLQSIFQAVAASLTTPRLLPNNAT